MNQVAEFTRYVGLVVLISAAILLFPRATVAAWAGFTGWLRSRWQDVLAWRPHTEHAEPRALPVDVRVGARFRGHDPEVLEPSAPEGFGRAARRLWWFSREVLETGALVLAVVALLLRTSAPFVDLLPEPAVLTGDLMLVLATFLVMQRVIRDYPAEMLPSVRFPRRPHAGRVPTMPGRAAVRRSGRLDHAIELVVLAVVLLVVLAWPAHLGTYLGELRFGSAQAGTAVAWAFEIPWLVAVCVFLARESRWLPTAVPAASVRGVVLPLPERRAPLRDEGRRAA